MSLQSVVRTVVGLVCGVSLVFSPAAVQPAEEADADRTRPGYIPDPQGYWKGDPFEPGKVSTTRTPQAVVEGRVAEQRSVRQGFGIESPKQILFGDMHVHSTYSVDAFRFSLPLMQGSRGASPPADACDSPLYTSPIRAYDLNLSA